jgi:hypothetical protein
LNSNELDTFDSSLGIEFLLVNKNNRLEMDLGTVFSYRYFSLDSNKVPKAPLIHHLINSSWNEHIPYTLSFGETRGSVVCKGCFKRIIDRLSGITFELRCEY